MTPLVLASGSPRRAKILADLGVAFTVCRTDAPEVSYPHDPERTVRENARLKGEAARAVVGSDAHVLSADTIVWFANRIFGKPRDLAEAKDFLRLLSGRTHVVFTGVALDGEVVVSRSDVTFRVLSEETIDAYVARVKPTDRAGAYDIDESGDLLVSGYTGSYENIMGLPVEPLAAWGLAGNAFVGREFVHFKGGRYRLRGFARDSETLETMVVYEALYGEGGLWVRPAKMFFGDVTRDGRTFRRFQLLEEGRGMVLGLDSI